MKLNRALQSRKHAMAAGKAGEMWRDGRAICRFAGSLLAKLGADERMSVF